MRPIEYGADILFIQPQNLFDGHGTSIGGVIVDGGKENLIVKLAVNPIH